MPSFPQKPWPITARQLLGHFSGIRHYANDEIDSTRHYADLLAPLQIFASDPLLFEPGAKYSYTTYGYCLLGAAVEAASDTRFVDYLRRHIFEPAAMDHIAPDNVYAIIPNRARGYRKSASGAIENGALLKKQTMEQMWTRQRLRSGEMTNYRLGWGIGNIQGKKMVAHGGGQQGTATHLLLVPETGVAVAVMTNLERATPARIATQIAEIVLKP